MEDDNKHSDEKFPTEDEVLEFEKKRESMDWPDASSGKRMWVDPPAPYRNYPTRVCGSDPLAEFMGKLTDEQLAELVDECPCNRTSGMVGKLPGDYKRRIYSGCRYCRMALDKLRHRHHERTKVPALKHWYDKLFGLFGEKEE